MLTLTLTPNPCNPIPHQKERIVKAGGRVFAVKYNDGMDGPQRVWLGNMDMPGLAMSRSLGDTVAHTAGVTSHPDTHIYGLDMPCRDQKTPGSTHSSEAAASSPPAAAAATDTVATMPPPPGMEDRHGDALPLPENPGGGQGDGGGGEEVQRVRGEGVILLLATDGLWEFLTSQQCVDIAASCAEPRLAVEHLIKVANEKWMQEEKVSDRKHFHAEKRERERERERESEREQLALQRTYNGCFCC
ncbi:unnamed protein product [Discosporangium mesarthrocarpum]